MNNIEEVYLQWVKDGCETDQNGSVPHNIKMYYLFDVLRKYELKSFVESGTSYGDGVAAMLPYVDVVHTIEAWQTAYEFSCSRFEGDARVHLHFGDSGVIIPELLNDLEPSVFWLDAHYSGDGTAMLDKETPIMAELEAISAAGPDNHCIVIDDARGFGVWNDYPSIDELKAYCVKAFPNHTFHLDGDEIFILPERA